jgi:hypothetical protein
MKTSCYDDSKVTSFCPKCGGEVVFEGNGPRCVHDYGMRIGCGWRATYASGIQPLAESELTRKMLSLWEEP